MPERQVSFRRSPFRKTTRVCVVCCLAKEFSTTRQAGIRYRHNSRGQIVIESKEEARKRGVKSPDRAEAVMLAFAETGNKADIRFFTDDSSPMFCPRLQLLSRW